MARGSLQRKEKKIQGEKSAHDARFEQKKKREILLFPLLDAPGRGACQNREKCREQNHRQADCVDAEMIGNTELRNPGDFFNKLKAGDRGVKTAEHEER